MSKKIRALSSDTFDKAFDAGEDITSHLDLGKAHRPGLESQRLSVDSPAWMVDGLDHAAERLGITRQALIKGWLAERLERNT